VVRPACCPDRVARLDLRQLDGKPAVVTAVAPRTEVTRVYNLCLADVHTFSAMSSKATVLTTGEHPEEPLPAQGRREAAQGAREAQQAVRDLSARVERDGFPDDTIPDTAYSDRVLVPIGIRGVCGSI
jgi:hypothetical protein